MNAAPESFKASIRRFLSDYLGSSDFTAKRDGVPPVPFGGRTFELKFLNDWLVSLDAPRNLLVTAPAGRGKSALLVRWIDQLSGEWPVCFIPISIRYGTNRAAVFYQALAARLASVLGETLSQTPSDPATFYRERTVEYLDKFSGNDLHCLIVIDAVDEAAGWQLDTSVLPSDPPPGVRIVVSARQLAGDRGPDGWLRRLGWDSRGRDAEVLDLRLLTRDGVRDVLFNMGFPIRELSADVDIVSELFRLTEQGDPLLLQFYATDLWERGPEAPRLAPKDLKKLKPGFAGYFNKWFDQQRKAWKEAELSFSDEEISACLLVLSCVLGPIKFSDFSAIIQRLLRPGLLMSRQLLEPLGRFIIGDGIKTGYAFAHPKLGIFIQEDYFAGSRSIQDTRRAIVDWGRSMVQALNAGTMEAKDASDYALLYHVQHVEQIRAQVDLACFTEVVENGWRTAWLAHEEGLRGFARDVQVAYANLRMAGQRDRKALKNPKTGLGGLIRCALCLSSIRSVGAAVPPNFLAELVRQEFFTPRQALHLSRMKPEAEQVPTLRALGRYLRGADLEEAIGDARALDLLASRAAALAELACWCDDLRRPGIFEEAREAASMSSESARQHALNEVERIRNQFVAGRGGLIANTSPERSPLVIPNASSNSPAPTDARLALNNLLESGNFVYGDPFQRLLPHLSEDLVDELLHRILHELPEFERQYGLAKLVPRLTERQLSDTLDFILVESTLGQYHRYHLMVSIRAHLPLPLLLRALDGVMLWEEDYERSRTFVELVSDMPPEPLEARAVSLIQAAGRYPAPVWVALASRVSIGSIGMLTQRLLEFADYQKKQALALAAPDLTVDRLREVNRILSGKLPLMNILLPFFPETERVAIVTDTYKVGFRIADGIAVVAALVATATGLPPDPAKDAVNSAWRTIRQMPEGSERGFAALLLSIGAAVPRDMRREAALEVQRIAGKLSSREIAHFLKCGVLISDGIADSEKDRAIPSLIHELVAARDAYDFQAAFLALLLTPRLVQEDREKLLEMLAPEVSKDDAEWVALAALMPGLSPERARSYIEQATAETNEEDNAFLSTFSALSPALSRAEAEQAAQQALSKVKPDVERVIIPAILLPYASGSLSDEALDKLLDGLSRCDREEVLSAISLMGGHWLVPFGIHPALSGGEPSCKGLEDLGGTYAAQEVYDSIRDVLAWWP